MTLSFRLATRADATACNEFQARFLKHRRTTDQWLWEFAPHRDDRPILYALAVDGDEIVGSQALIRMPMLGPQGRFDTGKGEDTLIHPRFWGKNLLRPLYELLKEKAHAEGIRLLWGFNSSRHVFEQIGFKYLRGDQAFFMLRPLSSQGLRRIALFDRHGNAKPAHKAMTWRHRLAASPIMGVGANLATAARARASWLARTFSARQSSSVRELPRSPASIDGLLTRFVQESQSITIFRSDEFVRWRLSENPWSASRLLGAFRGDQLVGFAAFSISPDRFGMISDLIVSDPHGTSGSTLHTTYDLLSHATTAMAKAGAQLVQLPIMNQHESAATTVTAARMLGYLTVPIRSRACIMPIGDSLDANLLESRRWHFTNINTEGRDG